MKEILEYDKITVSYQGEVVVKDCSFSLKEGEILGIVGESGSGKSTLLKAAMGLLGNIGRIEQGEIFYQSKKITKLSPSERQCMNGPELGMIFQNTENYFCPIRTVGSQLYESVRAHEKIKKKQFEEKAFKMLKKLGFEDGKQILKSYFFELSGGMQQRVGIAAAMLMHPKVLLADEPTSALDGESQKQVVDLMKMVQEQFGTAIVLVTHDEKLLEEVADRVLRLSSQGIEVIS